MPMVRSTWPDWIGRDAGGGVLDDVEGDAADRRLWSPVIFVTLEDDPGVELVLDELIGTCADGFFAEGVGTNSLHILLRHDVAAHERQPLRRSRGRGAELDDAFGRGGDLNLCDVTPGIGDVELMTGFDPLEEGIAEVFHRHLLAVVEDDVVADLDRHAEAVGRKLPFGDQAWDDLERRALIERLIKDHLEDGLRIWCKPLIGIPGRNVGWPADRDGVGSLRPGNRSAGEQLSTGRTESQHLKYVSAFDLECHVFPLCWPSRSLLLRVSRLVATAVAVSLLFVRDTRDGPIS